MCVYESAAKYPKSCDNLRHKPHVNVTITINIVLSREPRKTDRGANHFEALGRNSSEIISATLTLALLALIDARPFLLLSSHSART